MLCTNAINTSNTIRTYVSDGTIVMSFLPRGAMLARYMLSSYPSVRQSQAGIVSN